MIVSKPITRPVAIPVAVPMVRTPLLLDHVPPPVASVYVAVEPTQMVPGPEMAAICP
jgi:hypothetical protein